MELYTYIRENELQLQDVCKLLNISVSSLKKYMTHERTPTLEVAYKVLKTFDGKVRIEDMLGVTINKKNLRPINVKKMPKSRRWKSVKAIAASCRIPEDKVYLDKPYSRNRNRLPPEWFEFDELSFL